MFKDQNLSSQNELIAHQPFNAVVSNYPKITAVIFSKKSITYFELNKKVEIPSNTTLNLVSNRQIIGISATRTIEMIICLSAVLKTEKSSWPLAPRYPENRLRRNKEDPGVSTCISLVSASKPLPGPGFNLIHSDKLYAPTLHTTTSSQSENRRILYMSGVTDKPKRICLIQERLSSFLSWQQEHSLPGNDVDVLPFCHLGFHASFQNFFVLLNVSGPTQTTVWRAEKTLTSKPNKWASTPTTGEIIAQSSVYFLDENLRFLKKEEIGEMNISGPCLSNRYLHQIKPIKEKFIKLSHPRVGKIQEGNASWLMINPNKGGKFLQIKID